MYKRAFLQGLGLDRYFMDITGDITRFFSRAYFRTNWNKIASTVGTFVFGLLRRSRHAAIAFCRIGTE
jgi:hypothetical protein